MRLRLDPRAWFVADPTVGGSAMSGNGSEAASRSVRRAQGLLALIADQTASDTDQTASDEDQTASDADQTAAERDAVDAANDQRASDEDQATAEAALSAAGRSEAFGASRAARAAGTLSRVATHAARVGTSFARAETATARDVTAASRDETAVARDRRAEAIERSITTSGGSLAEQIEELRANAAASRALAAADRARAARDRADAARERARLEADLLNAHLDGLTGAYRREMGTLSLALELDRARRGDGRFVVAFVDVDGLKLVNDRDGHLAGDRLLRTLVSTMRAHLRSFDPIVRYGGDEFVCGIAGVGLADVAQRFALVDHALRGSVGTGVTVGLAAATAAETLHQIVARADASLLAARRSRHAR